MTNGDRIRLMPNDELADIIMEYVAEQPNFSNELWLCDRYNEILKYLDAEEE